VNLFDVLILSIVEGITEFLPVSSTGHLILTGFVLGIKQTDFVKCFEIAIQLGAILSIVVLYGKSLLIDTRVIKRILVAFIPTAIMGAIFYKIIKTFFMGNCKIVLWSLFLGGIILILFELRYKEKNGSLTDIRAMSYTQALIIGLFQSVALIPGVSRAAATIIGGLSLGLRRQTIVEFSFLLAVPTMLAATVFDVWKNYSVFTQAHFVFLLIGIAASFIAALVSVKFLVGFLKKHNFVVFGVYRMLIALLFWLIVKI